MASHIIGASTRILHGEHPIATEQLESSPQLPVASQAGLATTNLNVAMASLRDDAQAVCFQHIVSRPITIRENYSVCGIGL